MRPPVALFVAAAAVFVLTLIVRLPLAWTLPLWPSTALCTAPSGSIWAGRCADLALQGRPIGTVQWQLRPLALFAGRASADVNVTRALDQVSGTFSRSFGGTVRATDLKASLDLGSGVLPSWPSDIRGKLEANVQQLEISAGRVRALNGVIDVRELVQARDNSSLGSYRAEFTQPADAEGKLVGSLNDTAGAISLAGTITLTPEPGYEINGQIATRDGAPPALVQQLQYLGTPDAEGRRPFSLAGSY